MLVLKGVLTQEEASNVMVDTAGDIRAATEGEPGFTGEVAARAYERLATLILGAPEPEGEVSDVRLWGSSSWGEM
jgi:hypothetical protein